MFCGQFDLFQTNVGHRRSIDRVGVSQTSPTNWNMTLYDNGPGLHRSIADQSNGGQLIINNITWTSALNRSFVNLKHWTFLRSCWKRICSRATLVFNFFFLSKFYISQFSLCRALLKRALYKFGKIIIIIIITIYIPSIKMLYNR